MVKTMAKKKQRSSQRQEKLLNCPRCATAMKKLKKGDVVLDVCPACKGLWLDAGEVEKLAAIQRGKP